MSSPQATPASLPKLPVALTLPDETWVQILLELDYCHLKKASRISKKLQRFIKGKEFESILFRTGPSSLAISSNIVIHPLIKRTDCVFTRLEHAEIYGGRDEQGEYESYFPKDYPTILDEFATRPTSIRIDIEMEDAPVERLPPLRNSTGITVRDFFEHLAKFWSTPASKRLAAHHAETYGKQVAVVTYMDCLFHRYVWTYWRDVIDQGGNCTLLVANGFDS
ncbi:hypothetical protein JCM5353_003038 [Sporobolomyces roseus]